MSTKLKQWLERERGRSAELAERLNVSPSAVSQCASGDRPIPQEWMFEIRDFSGGEISIEEMIAANLSAKTTA